MSEQVERVHTSVIVREEGTVTPSLYEQGIRYTMQDLPSWLCPLRELLEDEGCTRITIVQRNATYIIVPVEQGLMSEQHSGKG